MHALSKSVCLHDIIRDNIHSNNQEFHFDTNVAVYYSDNFNIKDSMQIPSRGSNIWFLH